jgi:hypothetical protein
MSASPRPPSSQAPQNANPGYTCDDIHYGPLIKWTLTLWVATGIIFVVLLWYLRAQRDANLETKGLQTERVLPPVGSPLLQANPIRDLDEYRAEQAARLTGYAVVDATNQIFRIPIDVAKRRLLETGAFKSATP